MASFRAHTSVGIIIAVVLSGVAITSTLISANIYVLGVVFLAVVGSFLPDLDSDSGVPFHIVFGLFALFLGGIALLYVWVNDLHELKYILGAPVGMFVFVRFIIGWLFKKFTNHRGMFHSIPALLISILSTLVISNWLEFSVKDSMFFALAIGLGFLSHLILDELVSVTNFSGRLFRPKKSLGSALKFVSRSRGATMTAYIVLAFCILLSIPVLI